MAWKVNKNKNRNPKCSAILTISRYRATTIKKLTLTQALHDTKSAGHKCSADESSIARSESVEAFAASGEISNIVVFYETIYTI